MKVKPLQLDLTVEFCPCGDFNLEFWALFGGLSTLPEFSLTESALLRVSNDILKAVDDNSTVLLLSLDLSAAFDTVDHVILLKRLRDRFGIKGTALAWIRSYLTNRKQFVSIRGAYGTPKLRGQLNLLLL